MKFVSFDEFKGGSTLENEVCGWCEGEFEIECDCCGHESYCEYCNDGMVKADYEKEYLDNLNRSLELLKKNRLLSFSIIKSSIELVRSDGRLDRKYNEMRRQCVK